MRLIFFSKTLKGKTIAELVDAAHEFGFEGYDLCVRPGYAVNPENVSEALPETARQLAAEGLPAEMVTMPTDIVPPEDPSVEPLLSAMDKSGVRLVKLGYAHYGPGHDYWKRVDELRRDFAVWEQLGRRHQVKICYHTHSGSCFGLNCAALMHLLKDYDPSCVGAYIDPAHMVVDGEPFPLGVAMVRDYLSIVALKDVLVDREDRGDEGGRGVKWVTAGQGCVAWTEVFAELARAGYDGPLSVHAEYRAASPEEHLALLKPEVEYFRKKRDAISAQYRAPDGERSN
jgi:sugar phosphate isomerase/epimerase